MKLSQVLSGINQIAKSKFITCLYRLFSSGEYKGTDRVIGQINNSDPLNQTLIGIRLKNQSLLAALIGFVSVQIPQNDRAIAVQQH